MGVAIADNPEGPYLRHSKKPVIEGGHEVIIWPYGKGVVALITTAGKKDMINTLQYSEDGVTFSKMMDDLDVVKDTPGARDLILARAAFKRSKAVDEISEAVENATKTLRQQEGAVQFNSNQVIQADS